jgi:hypothetical protein
MSVHGLGDEQHSVDQGSFTAESMADDGYGANLRSIDWHLENLPKNWFTL